MNSQPVKSDVAMIGLGVMGSSLARNIARHGYTVAVYNHHPEMTAEFLEKFGGPSTPFTPFHSLEDLVMGLARPRKVFIMVQAGAPVDSILAGLLPYLEVSDIVVDGGNSFYRDTQERQKRSAHHGVHFVGMGVSGGEEGALNGPSLMPGGTKVACDALMPILEKIAARADGPCAMYVGPGGAGHYVKMVHNGIEYADMQLIAEAYDVLRRICGCTPAELADIFATWNDGLLHSFLIEITAKIFRTEDKDTKTPLIEKILDTAGMKGTGSWTAQSALDLGVPIPTISAAVTSRALGALREERLVASQIYKVDIEPLTGGERTAFIDAVRNALTAAKIIAYAQGMSLIRGASKTWDWKVDLAGLAAIWKGGCIIRARLLEDLRQVFTAHPEIPSILVAPEIRSKLEHLLPDLRQVIVKSIGASVPTIGFSTSLGFFDSYIAARLPLNLTQAQRDFFGAHKYERTDRPGQFHTLWK